MPGTGSYSGGSASADYRFSAAALLSEIPDNNAQLIQAKNVRDSVWTLWNRIDDVQITASQAASQSAVYSNSNPMPQRLGGLTAGTTFSNNSMSEIFDELFYPYINPTIQLSASPTTKQYGSPCNVSLTYSVRPGTSNPVSSITVDGTGVVPSGSYQTGTIVHNTATHSTNPSLTSSNVFTMSVGYGGTTSYATASIMWAHRFYIGQIDLSGAPTFNPDLNFDQSGPTLAAVAAKCTDAAIKGLSSSSLYYNLSQLLNNEITGEGKYYIFALPSDINSGNLDIFIDNNKVTSFTRVRTNSTFSNEYGFTHSYDVYVSNVRKYGTSDISIKPASVTGSVILNTGTLLNAPIRPYTTNDPIATAFSEEIRGGHHSYATIAERDAIIEPRREWGMMTTIYNDGVDNGIYTLTYNFVNTDIMDNSNWVILNNGELNTKYYISPSESITVPAFTEYFIYGDLEVAGQLTNYGKVIVANGGFSVTGAGTFSNYGEIDVVTIGGSSGGLAVQYLIDTTESVEVPVNYEYLVYGDLEIKGEMSNAGKVVIINGSLYLNGGTFSNTGGGTLELVSVGTQSGGSGVATKYLIETTDDITVPEFEEYLVYGDLEIQGTLTNNGKVVIIDGDMVMNGGTFSNISGNLELISTNTMIVGRPVIASPVDVMLKTDSSGKLGYATSSVFIYSPNGTKWKIEIDDFGLLSTTLA